MGTSVSAMPSARMRVARMTSPEAAPTKVDRTDIEDPKLDSWAVRASWQPGRPYTDRQCWLFNAYNGPGTLHIDGLMDDSITSSGDINVAQLSEHVGDWEMFMIRVNNTTLNLDGMWLSEHAKGQFITADQIDRKFGFQGTQPIIFSALNGHGNWYRAGGWAPGRSARPGRRLRPR